MGSGSKANGNNLVEPPQCAHFPNANVSYWRSTGCASYSAVNYVSINKSPAHLVCHPAPPGCVTLVVMPSIFGMMVRHPMMHGFRPIVTPGYTPRDCQLCCYS